MSSPRQDIRAVSKSALNWFEAMCRSAARLWTGERVSFKNDYFDFTDVALKPTPVKPIPIWYGGGTPAACRRAVEYCDGWMPARITLATFAKLMAYIRELCNKAGKPMISAAVMPFTSVSRDRETALSGVNIESLIAEANKFSTWVKPRAGGFQSWTISAALFGGNPRGYRARDAAPMKKRAPITSFTICAFATPIGWSRSIFLGKKYCQYYEGRGDRPVARIS